MRNKNIIDYFIHPTSIIDEKVKIGVKTKIWHFSHISQNVKIGKNCILGQNTFIGNNVVIKNNVKIQNNVSVYEGVELRDNVFCGPSVVFTNVLYPRSIINKKKKYLKTIVDQGSTLGANSTILCGIKIGKFSFIGAGSLVTKNTKPFSLNYGNPCTQKGWVSRSGNKLNLPLSGKGKCFCKVSKKYYFIKNNELVEKDFI